MRRRCCSERTQDDQSATAIATEANVVSHLLVRSTLILLSLAACKAEDLYVCPADGPRVSVSPRERALSVGEQFTPTVTATICAGSTVIPFEGRFRSGNASVVAVDAASGLVTAVTRGETFVYAQNLRSAGPAGGVSDSVRVLVR